MQERKNAKELLKKYNAGICTDEERALIESWYFSLKKNEEELNREDLNAARLAGWEKLIKTIRTRHKTYTQLLYKAAAAIFIIISAGLIFHHTKNSSKQPLSKKVSKVKNDLPPGGNKASLTLADGTVVLLDEIQNGEINEASGVRISKTKEGLLVYQAVDLPGNFSDEILSSKFNRITTPRGGQYQVILPDGTKVWLNAASSLRYPIQFTAKERKVELTGEAYFEVSRVNSPNNLRVPFIVETSSQVVEVLGTHFNINSYEDENKTFTTLIEGSVRVYPSSQPAEKSASVVLKPRQQAVWKTNKLNVEAADIESALAWKNGYFSFTHADIQTVMQQLSRWYNVDAVYTGSMSSETFTGKVPKNISLSQVLEILSYADVNFKIQGRKIFIYP